MALPLQEDLAMTIGAKTFGEGNVPVSDRKTNFRSFTVRPTLKIWLTIGLVDVQIDGHIDMLIALP